MIKYINDGEINELKLGFYNTLAFKKISMLNIKKLMNEDIDLETANKIYELFAEFKFPSCDSYFSETMLKYFVENNWFSQDEFNTITKVFFSNKESDSSLEFGDFSVERYEFLTNFIKEIASEKGIVLHIESFKDIFMSESEYIDINIFGDIRELLRSYISSSVDITNYTYEDWDERYCSIFQDDATCYVFEGYEMSKYEANQLQSTFYNAETAVVSEVYVEKGNTYITISDMQIDVGLGYDFLIILKLILKSKN